MTKVKKRRTLPGDHVPATSSNIKHIIRVNHAGEYGAKRIYQGQLAALKDDPETCTLIEHMAEQEDVHLKYFEDEIVKRQIRPTAFHPVWHLGGYAMGYITGKMGKRAAMACTVAVEEVIANHYQSQIDALEGDSSEKSLRTKIAQFKAEEEEHHDIGLDNDAELTKGYSVLSGAIKMISKGAIEVAKRF